MLKEKCYFLATLGAILLISLSGFLFKGLPLQNSVAVEGSI